MQSPSKGQTLYELPSCTICLQELQEDLSCLDCGHIFHLTCIYQQFEYRGSCPNCQKRASRKEVRSLRLLFTPQTQVRATFKPTMPALPPSEKQQWEALMSELKQATESSQKLKAQVGALEGQVKSKTKTVESLRQQVYRLKDERDKLSKDNRKLSSDCKELSYELNERMRAESRLRLQAQRLKANQKELQQMHRYKKLLAQNSQEIVKYKAELEARSTPAEEIAKAFYDMLLMKNLQILRAKERLSQIPERMSEKEYQLSRQHQTIEALKKQAREVADKRAAERKRYDELKERYRLLVQKAKQKGVKEVDIPSIDENSQSISNKMLAEPPLIESATRKPYAGHITIGGFLSKKKDDRLKTAL